MIEVQGLSKWYGDFQALREVSFSVAENQIAGFLGANGAGKTTTMRILACFLPATSGVARVGGFDVFTQSLSVRQVLGYMPQSSPMYPDMRVEEFLRYVADLRDVPPHRVIPDVEAAMAKSGLLRPEDMHRRLIGTLSGGYRQRVGLAAALLHRPRVLILDEPTAGLDPVEIRNTRQVIRELATEHTVLLSTHILSEVQQICSKVVIIARGSVVADAPLAELVRRQGQSRLELSLRGPTPAIRERLAKLEGVHSVEVASLPAVAEQPSGASSPTDSASSTNGVAELLLTTAADRDVRPEVARVAAENGWPLLEMHRRQETLEDIYVRITQSER